MAGWDETEVATIDYWITALGIPSASVAPTKSQVNETFSTEGQEVFTLDLAPSKAFNPKLQPFYGLSLNGVIKLQKFSAYPLGKPRIE
jgi:hypothetical protein